MLASNGLLLLERMYEHGMKGIQSFGSGVMLLAAPCPFVGWEWGCAAGLAGPIGSRLGHRGRVLWMYVFRSMYSMCSCRACMLIEGDSLDLLWRSLVWTGRAVAAKAGGWPVGRSALEPDVGVGDRW